MEKRTVVRRVELGVDGGTVHVVLAKQLAEPCEITKTDDDGTHSEPGERLLVDEPHRFALYPLDPSRPAENQLTLDQQIEIVQTHLASIGYPPIAVDGVAKIKHLIAAL